MSDIISSSWASEQAEFSWAIVVKGINKYISQGNTLEKAYLLYLAEYADEFTNPVLNKDDFWAEPPTEDENLRLLSEGEFGMNDVYPLTGSMSDDECVVGFHKYAIMALYKKGEDGVTALLTTVARVD